MIYLEMRTEIYDRFGSILTKERRKALSIVKVYNSIDDYILPLEPSVLLGREGGAYEPASPKHYEK